MKKSLIAASLLTLTCAPALAADDWRIAVGGDVWNAQGSGQVRGWTTDYDHNYNWSGYLQLEHGILLLPNARLETTDFSTSGGLFDNDLDAYNLTLYYRLFNNDLFSIDLGLTGRRYEGDFNTLHESYDRDLLMAYVGSEVMLPATGLSLFGDARVRESSHYDYRLGAAYSLPTLPFKIRAGWRDAELDVGQVDQGVEGWFVGAEFSF